MRMLIPLFRGTGLAALALLLSTAAARAQQPEPGVNVASPRFAISLVDDGFLFRPDRLVVEQGDWVRWRHIGVFMIHTTTSGSNCTASGLWNAGLSAGQQFTRQFMEPPQTIRYYCQPHCLNGMVGQVVVTTPIQVRADSASPFVLSWTGGGGIYRVLRSNAASFATPATETLTPVEGVTETTFTDELLPDRGKVLYYLVMNKF